MTELYNDSVKAVNVIQRNWRRVVAVTEREVRESRINVYNENRITSESNKMILKNVLLIQNWMRMVLARNNLKRKLKTIQKYIIDSQHEEIPIYHQNAATSIQRWIRRLQSCERVTTKQQIIRSFRLKNAQQEIREDYACCRIQSAVRRRLAMKYYFRLRKAVHKYITGRQEIPHHPAILIQTNWRRHYSLSVCKSKVVAIRNYLSNDREYYAAVVIQKIWKRRLACKQLQQKLNEVKSHINNLCLRIVDDDVFAIIIQRNWRRFSATGILSKKVSNIRSYIKTMNVNDNAAITIQKIWKGLKTVTNFKHLQSVTQSYIKTVVFECPAVLIIQKSWRCYCARQLLFKKKSSQIEFQTKLLESESVINLNNNAAAIQRFWKCHYSRGLFARKQITARDYLNNLHFFETCNQPARIIQRYWRQHQCRLLFVRKQTAVRHHLEHLFLLEKQFQSACCIQRAWKCQQARKLFTKRQTTADDYLRLLTRSDGYDKPIHCIQRAWKCHRSRLLFAKKQTAVCDYVSHLLLLEEQFQSVCCIQRAWACHQSRKLLIKRETAVGDYLKLLKGVDTYYQPACCIQRTWRCHHSRTLFTKRQSAVCDYLKIFVVIERHEHSACCVIQKNWRGYLARLKYTAIKGNVETYIQKILEIHSNPHQVANIIQKVWKGYVTRIQYEMISVNVKNYITELITKDRTTHAATTIQYWMKSCLSKMTVSNTKHVVQLYITTQIQRDNIRDISSQTIQRLGRNRAAVLEFQNRKLAIGNYIKQLHGLEYQTEILAFRNSILVLRAIYCRRKLQIAIQTNNNNRIRVENCIEESPSVNRLLILLGYRKRFFLSKHIKLYNTTRLQEEVIKDKHNMTVRIQQWYRMQSAMIQSKEKIRIIKTTVQNNILDLLSSENALEAFIIKISELWKEHRRVLSAKQQLKTMIHNNNEWNSSRVWFENISCTNIPITLQQAARSFRARVRLYRRQLSSQEYIAALMSKENTAYQLVIRTESAVRIQSIVRRHQAIAHVRHLTKLIEIYVRDIRWSEFAKQIQTEWRNYSVRLDLRQKIQNNILLQKKRVEIENYQDEVVQKVKTHSSYWVAFYRARRELFRRKRVLHEITETRVANDNYYDIAAGEKAAVKLQSAFRRSVAQSLLKSLFEKKKRTEDNRVDHECKQDRAMTAILTNCCLRIQSCYRGRRGRLAARNVRLKRHIRMLALQEKGNMWSHDKNITHESILTIQRAWRVALSRKTIEGMCNESYQENVAVLGREQAWAAMAVQLCWRAWIQWKRPALAPTLQIQAWYRLHRKSRAKRRDRAARKITKFLRAGVLVMHRRRAIATIQFYWRVELRRRGADSVIKSWICVGKLLHIAAAMKLQRVWYFWKYYLRENRERVLIKSSWALGFTHIALTAKQSLPPSLLNIQLPKLLLNSYLSRVAKIWDEEQNHRQLVIDLSHQEIRCREDFLRELRLKREQQRRHKAGGFRTFAQKYLVNGANASTDEITDSCLNRMLWYSHKIPIQPSTERPSTAAHSRYRRLNNTA